MNKQFDELTKGLAQSLTRRGALKKFGLGVLGAAVASLGLANRAEAKWNGHCNCKKPYYGCNPANTECLQNCYGACSP